MRKLNMGWMMGLALALAMPSFSTAFAAGTKSESAGTAMSKDEAEKLREHNKLRVEIKKVKYPAPKSKIVAQVKGIKPDDKKWFADTLPDKTYESADDVFSALGWENAPAPSATPSK